MQTRLTIQYINDYGYNASYIVPDEENPNWDDIKYTLKRKDYGQVVRTFSNEFTFSGEARNLLIGVFLRDYMRSYAKILLQALDDHWEWQDIFSCELDMASFRFDEHTATVNCKSGGLSAMLASKKTTKYEFHVDEIKEPNKLYYDRVIRYKNAVHAMAYTETKYAPGGTVGKVELCETTVKKNQDKDVAALVSIPMNLDSSIIDAGAVKMQRRVVLDSSVIDIGTDGNCVTSKSAFDYFFRADRYCEVRVKFRIRWILDPPVGTGKYENYTQILCDSMTTTKIVLLRGTPTDDKKAVSWSSVMYEDITSSWSSVIDFDVPCDMIEGEMLSLAVVCPAYKTRFGSSNFDKFTVKSNIWFGSYEFSNDIIASYELVDAGPGIIMRTELSKDNKALFYDPFLCDVVKPQRLLQRLIDEISSNTATSYIDTDGYSILSHTMIASAESVRGVPDAMIYTSYSAFCDWMSSVFGFIPIVDDDNNTIVFRHRDKIYRDDVVSDIGGASGSTSIEINSSLVYSAVHVGYGKQEYEEEYGRDEWRYTSVYTTGFNVNENVLQLISPYRCDSYGMEYIAAERRNHDTTDDKQDSDVFFVHCQINDNGTYTFIRDAVVDGVENADTLFNVEYSQPFMLMNNKSLLAGLVDLLEFASLEGGNSEVSIDSPDWYFDIGMDIEFDGFEPLYNSAVCKVVTGDTEPPADWGGLFTARLNGAEITGYLDEVEFSVGRETSATYTLMIKSITQ